MRYLLACLAVCLGAFSALADVSALVKKLASKDNEQRREAARELGDLGKGAKDALKPLIKALNDRDRFVRRFAAQAIGGIGADAKLAIPALAAALNDDSQPVREAAVKALATMGKEAVPALTKALKGTSDVQETAIKALGATGEAGVPALTEAIRDDKMGATLRSRAIASLPQDKAARPALPALVDAVNKPAPGGRDGRQFRLDAIAALGRLATPSDSLAIKALDDLVLDEKLRDMQIKNGARAALKAVKSRSRPSPSLDRGRTTMRTLLAACGLLALLLLPVAVSSRQQPSPNVVEAPAAVAGRRGEKV